MPRCLPAAFLAISWSLQSQEPSVAPPCDEACLRAWWQAKEKGVELLPPELQHDYWLRLGAAEKSGPRLGYLVRRAWERILECQEAYPVQSRLSFTDSLPGASQRLTSRYPTQLQLRAAYVLLLGKHDLNAAVDLWQTVEIPRTSSISRDRDEEASLFPYFDAAFQLVENLRAHERHAQANLLLTRTVRSAKTWSAIGALSRALAIRAQKIEFTENLVGIYLENLRQVDMGNAPDAQTWMFCLQFWRVLLVGELKGSRELLWASLEQVFSKAEAGFPPEFPITVQTRLGATPVRPFWPTDAKKLWESRIAALASGDEEAQRLKRLTGLLFAETQNTRIGERRNRVLLHARPQAKQLYESMTNLIRSREKLQPIGAWEGSFREFLAAVRNFREKVETEEELALSFLERHYAWLPALKGFGQSPEKAPSGQEALKQMQSKRPEHSLKSIILRDALASLESEEGRKVYSFRRLYWLGVLRLYVDELRDHQPELLREFQEMAGASSSEAIRHLSDL